MIKAVDDKIIVLLMRRGQSQGGIVIPGNVADPQAYGKVMSKGENVPDTIKVDDVLVMHLNSGMDMVIERNLMRTIKYEEVYGVLEDEAYIKNLEEMIITGGTEGVPSLRPSSPLIQTVR